MSPSLKKKPPLPAQNPQSVAQVRLVAATEVDLVHAMTITYPAEAIGIARAAAGAGIPAVISFTTETDGRLPDGTSLAAFLPATAA